MRNRYVLLADLPAVAMAAFAAFALRFDLYFLHNRPEFVPYVLAAVAVKPVIFFLFGMYRRFWRYAAIQDLLALGLANSVASVVMAILVVGSIYRSQILEFSRSVLVADWLFCICATAAVRLSVRAISESRNRRRRTGDQQKRVLVVGAGDAGAIVTREMQRNAQLGMEPVAFLDDDPVKVGKRIYGVPVVGTLSRLSQIVEEWHVDEVIIAMPKAQGKAVRAVVEDCRRYNVTSRTMPGVYELLDGNVSVNRLRQVDITDLLRRTPVDLGSDAATYVQGRMVLVTGAGGSIGFELSRQVAHARPKGLILLGHGENSIFEAEYRLREACPGLRIDSVIADIRDRARLFRVFETARPEVIFHAAAHKHVPLMEENPEEAISNNVLGTQNVLDAAVRADSSRLVLISSDKAVSPASLMGASKRVAEALVHDAARRCGRAFVVVRFGNVLGSRGSVVPWFKRQIEAGGPITVTHPDMKRFFMTIPEAVHLVLQAGGMGKGGELFVLKMGEPLPIVQLAEDLIRLSGLSPDEIPIRFSGLRRGEKLEEALWEEGSVLHDTPHPEVLRVVEPRSVSPDVLARHIEALAGAAVTGDRQGIDGVLAELIPSYCRITVRKPSSAN
jgi:FlaA1/EpsC-like NDP-sugar epimerase